jgi:hypothetical protein
MHNIYLVYARTAIRLPDVTTMKNNLTMYLKKKSMTAVSVQHHVSTLKNKLIAVSVQPTGKAAKKNLTAVSPNVIVVKYILTTVSNRPYMTAVRII